MAYTDDDVIIGRSAQVINEIINPLEHCRLWRDRARQVGSIRSRLRDGWDIDVVCL